MNDSKDLSLQGIEGSSGLRKIVVMEKRDKHRPSIMEMRQREETGSEVEMDLGYPMQPPPPPSSYWYWLHQYQAYTHYMTENSERSVSFHPPFVSKGSCLQSSCLLS